MNARDREGLHIVTPLRPFLKKISTNYWADIDVGDLNVFGLPVMLYPDP